MLPQLLFPPHRVSPLSLIQPGLFRDLYRTPFDQQLNQMLPNHTTYLATKDVQFRRDITKSPHKGHLHNFQKIFTELFPPSTNAAQFKLSLSPCTLSLHPP